MSKRLMPSEPPEPRMAFLVRLPKSLRKALKLEAIEREVSANALLEHLVRKGLSK